MGELFPLLAAVGLLVVAGGAEAVPVERDAVPIGIGTDSDEGLGGLEIRVGDECEEKGPGETPRCCTLGVHAQIVREILLDCVPVGAPSFLALAEESLP